MIKELFVNKLLERSRYKKEHVEELIRYFEEKGYNLSDVESVRESVKKFAFSYYSYSSEIEIIREYGIDAFVSTLVDIVRSEEISDWQEAKIDTFVRLIFESLPDPEIIVYVYNEIREELLKESPKHWKDSICTIQELKEATEIADTISSLYHSADGSIEKAVELIAKRLNGIVYKAKRNSQNRNYVPEWLVVVEKDTEEFKCYPIYQPDETESGIMSFWKAFASIVMSLIKEGEGGN